MLPSFLHLAPLLADTLGPAATAPANPGSPVIPAALFYLFALIIAAGAFSVALARNIVRAATGLLFALAGMVGLYFLLQAEFLAAVQLVVYVGGTLILIIFGVMLTSKNANLTGGGGDPKRAETLWALLVTTCLIVPLIALSIAVWGNTPVPPITNTPYDIKALGKALLDPHGFLAPFELVSLVLLAVMIGAAYLAKGRQRPTDSKTAQK